MSTDAFTSSPGPVPAELHRLYLTKSIGFRVELRFDDDSYLTLDFEPESDGFDRIVSTLTRATTRTLSTLGGRGIVIVGTTSAIDEDGEGNAE